MPYILTIRDRNHSWAGRSPVISQHATRAEADSALFEYVRRNWQAEIGTEPPDDPAETVEEYFSEALEAYDIQELS